MTRPDPTPSARSGAAARPAGGSGVWLAALILVQVACALFFLWDVGADLAEGQALRAHMLPELGAALGLVAGIAVETLFLWRLLQRQARMQQGLGIAAGALADIIEGYFRDWALTPSEADVATFAIKGYAIAEIAQLRGTAEGTVKTHLNAIYRKAGVPGRSQLVSLLVEDLLRAPLLAPAPSANPRR